MNDLTLEREFPIAPEMVFDFVTREEHLKTWFGHPGWVFKDIKMDLITGKLWHAVMISEEGNTFKNSGVVTAYDPPNSVDFTWAWHDENDVRGHESNVRFTVEKAAKGGTLFKVIHTNLPSEEAAEGHSKGWAVTLSRLEAKVANI
jgi:uncharacterized protein YndB with AHSA1/START domain